MSVNFHHSAAQETYKISLRILEKRQRSTEELRRLLKERHCPEPAIDEVLDRLQDLGYLNDHELAHLFIRRAQAKGWGPKKIRMELRKRGLGERAVSLEEQGVDDDYPRILEMVTRLREKGKTDPQIMGSLMRRGHRRSLIMRALKEAPKSSWETELELPPGLLDLDDEEFDFAALGLDEEEKDEE